MRSKRVVVGVVARGQIAVGIVAMGGVSVGIVALGGVAIGVVALGGIAVGALALGGVALGWRVLAAVSLGGALTQGLIAFFAPCHPRVESGRSSSAIPAGVSPKSTEIKDGRMTRRLRPWPRCPARSNRRLGGRAWRPREGCSPRTR